VSLCYQHSEALAWGKLTCQIKSPQHERLVTLVESMLGLNQQLAAGKTPIEKKMLQRQIETTDRQIDALVYINSMG
jgi:hypothetical protein